MVLPFEPVSSSAPFDISEVEVKSPILNAALNVCVCVCVCAYVRSLSSRSQATGTFLLL